MTVQQSNEDGAEKQSPPKAVVVSDGALALAAGSDTTSTVLTAAFWCMLTRPQVYERLREEVDKFYPPGEDSTSPEHHPRMVYLEAIMYVTIRVYTINIRLTDTAHRNETLRMFPPVPSGSARAPLVHGGDRVVGL